MMQKNHGVAAPCENSVPKRYEEARLYKANSVTYFRRRYPKRAQEATFVGSNPPLELTTQGYISATNASQTVALLKRQAASAVPPPSFAASLHATHNMMFMKSNTSRATLACATHAFLRAGQ